MHRGRRPELGGRSPPRSEQGGLDGHTCMKNASRVCRLAGHTAKPTHQHPHDDTRRKGASIPPAKDAALGTAKKTNLTHLPPGGEPQIRSRPTQLPYRRSTASIRTSPLLASGTGSRHDGGAQMWQPRGTKGGEGVLPGKAPARLKWGKHEPPCPGLQPAAAPATARLTALQQARWHLPTLVAGRRASHPLSQDEQ